MYCSACARHGTATSIRKLLVPCPRAPVSDSYRYLRSRLSQGIHPSAPNGRLRRPTPLRDLTRERIIAANTDRLSTGRSWVDRRVSQAPRTDHVMVQLAAEHDNPLANEAEDGVGFESLDQE